MLTTLKARRLLTATGILKDPVITIDPTGFIESVSATAVTKFDSNSEDTLAPTFFDIHTHGAANHDVMEGTPSAFAAINRFFATKGVGRYLATTVTAPIDQTLESLHGIANAIESAPTPGHAQPIGIHLEGPFISHAKRGVHPVADIVPPDIALFERFKAAARGHIRLITIAPETPGAIDLIKHCVSLGIRVSLGHSNATSPETLAALAVIPANFGSATHTFNAMRPIDHRDPGILATVLDTDSLFAELICDGIHVAPELVRLWLKMKTEYRAILVTDSMAATGMPDGTYTLGNLSVTVTDGRCYLTGDLEKGAKTLAGSVLTMDRAVANLQRFTGAPLALAVRLASHNPAALLGLNTAIVPGQPASFNRFAPDGTLQSTVIRGHEVEA